MCGKRLPQTVQPSSALTLQMESPVQGDIPGHLSLIFAKCQSGDMPAIVILVLLFFYISIWLHYRPIAIKHIVCVYSYNYFMPCALWDFLNPVGHQSVCGLQAETELQCLHMTLIESSLKSKKKFSKPSSLIRRIFLFYFLPFMWLKHIFFLPFLFFLGLIFLFCFVILMFLPLSSTKDRILLSPLWWDFIFSRFQTFLVLSFAVFV